MRYGLDALYRLTGMAAAFCLVAILVLVVVQMVSRLVQVGVPGTDDFAAYALVATTFLALAPTFKAGAHIRVQVLLDRLPPRAARIAELWALGVAFALTAYFAWWTFDFVRDSWRFNEVATAMVATPLWIPRALMLLGLVVFAVALADELISTARRSDAQTRARQAAAEAQMSREL